MPPPAQWRHHVTTLAHNILQPNCSHGQLFLSLLGFIIMAYSICSMNLGQSFRQCLCTNFGVKDHMSKCRWQKSSSFSSIPLNALNASKVFFFHFFFSDMQPDEMKNFVIVFQYDSYAWSKARTLIAEVPFEASFVS